MFTPSKQALAVLSEFGATYRLHRIANDPHSYVQIIDHGTGKLYPDTDDPSRPLEVAGDDPQDAVEKACLLIPTTPKPMTRAQAASHAKEAEMAGKLSSKDQEIARLQQTLAAMQKTVDELAAARADVQSPDLNSGRGSAESDIGELGSTPTEQNVSRRGRRAANVIQ